MEQKLNSKFWQANLSIFHKSCHLHSWHTSPNAQWTDFFCNLNIYSDYLILTSERLSVISFSGSSFYRNSVFNYRMSKMTLQRTRPGAQWECPFRSKEILTLNEADPIMFVVWKSLRWLFCCHECLMHG